MRHISEKKHEIITIIIIVILVVSMLQYIFSSSLIFPSTDKETYNQGEKAVVTLWNLGLRNI